MAPMQGFVPISGKRQSWEELRKEVSVSIQPNVQNVIVDEKQTSNNHPISYQHTFI